MEMRELLVLAGPLVLAQIGQQAMSFVDNVMVGRLGAAASGGIGIGNAVYFAFTLLGYGCIYAADPLVSQAVGAGEHGRAREVLQRALALAVWLSIPLMAIVAALPFTLRWFGVNHEVAIEARAYLLGRAPNTLPLLVFGAQRAYLQAYRATRPIILATVVGNLANVIGNGLLIYGDGALAYVHLPGVLHWNGLGILGAGLSSSISSVLSVGVLAIGIRSLHLRSERSTEGAAVSMGQLFRIGLPIGAQLAAEVGVFALAAVLAGRMGLLPAAAYNVAIQLASASFTVAVGVGAATSVRVGLHVGRADHVSARRAGLCGIVAAWGFMSCSAIAFLVIPRALSRLLSSDEMVIEAAVPLLAVAAFFQLADGAQAVAAGALRGAGDTVISFIANVVCHWFIGLPIAIVLGFTLHWGAPGLWWGLSAGLTTVAIGLTWRFLRVTSRPIARV